DRDPDLRGAREAPRAAALAVRVAPPAPREGDRPRRSQGRLLRAPRSSLAREARRGPRRGPRQGRAGLRTTRPRGGAPMSEWISIQELVEIVEGDEELVLRLCEGGIVRRRAEGFPPE